MKGIITTTNGNVTIDENVIAKYAGTVAVGCFGIVGMAIISMKDGIVRLLRKDSLTKGINVDIDEDNEVILSFHVIVAYGVSIFTVSDNLISSVKYEVEKFSGLKVKKIQIYVEGVRIID
ncbi:MAG: Asp23/Gls24 family envelope stress response protein [Lachnospiraceae bacterium]|nr:Asp23/Gls24 family envelope stress response protein [Lachnospiraceae bacterium]